MVDNALARLGNPYPRGDVRHARSFDETVAGRAGGHARAGARLPRALLRRRARAVRRRGRHRCRGGAQRAARRLRRLEAAGAPFTRVPQPLRRTCTPERLRAAHARQAERHDAACALAAAAVGQRCRLSGADAGQPPARQRRQLAPVEAHPRDAKACRTTCAARVRLEQPRAQLDLARPARSSRRRTAPRSRQAFREELARALKDGFSDAGTGRRPARRCSTSAGCRARRTARWRSAGEQPVPRTAPSRSPAGSTRRWRRCTLAQVNAGAAQVPEARA